MTYDENRNTYDRNLKIGIAASVLFHALLLLLPFIFKGEDIVQFKDGYVQTKSAELDISNITVYKYEIERTPGGGGGGGGGTDPNGGGPAKELISGVPVPSAKQTNAQYDMISLPPPDSALKNQNLKVGPGYGTGEGTGTGSGTGSGSGSGKGSGHGSGTGDGTTVLPFTPKQILEVIPERSENFKGIIKLSVRIGKDGLVKDHRILQNSSNNPECLTKVLLAVYKSKWQSVKLEGRVVEYWTEKTYRFE